MANIEIQAKSYMFKCAHRGYESLCIREKILVWASSKMSLGGFSFFSIRFCFTFESRLTWECILGNVKKHPTLPLQEQCRWCRFWRWHRHAAWRSCPLPEDFSTARPPTRTECSRCWTLSSGTPRKVFDLLGSSATTQIQCLDLATSRPFQIFKSDK